MYPTLFCVVWYLLYGMALHGIVLHCTVLYFVLHFMYYNLFHLFNALYGMVFILLYVL